MLCSFSNCAGGDHCHNNLKEESEECLFYFWHIKYIIPICSCTNKSEIAFNMVESSIMKSFLSTIIRILMEKKENVYI